MRAPDKTLVFVEVKSRIANPFGSALEQIDETKLSHLKKAIALYLHRYDIDETSCRLDAVGIEYIAHQTGGNVTFEIKNIEYVEDITGW